MASKRETILARVATVLAGTVSVGSRIYRSRVEALARAEAPALVVEPVADAAQGRGTLAHVTWQLSFRVYVIARGLILDQVADPIAVDVHSRIMADPTLDGLAVDIMPASVAFEAEAIDGGGGVVALEYIVTYRTLQNSIE